MSPEQAAQTITLLQGLNDSLATSVSALKWSNGVLLGISVMLSMMLFFIVVGGIRR